MATETREVSNFDRIVMRGYGDLRITQAEQESLIIEADEEILPRIKTEVHEGELRIDVVDDWVERIFKIFSQGLDSQRINYNLSIKRLNSLKITGAARVRSDALEAAELAIEAGGAVEMEINALKSQKLQVKFPGTGQIKLSGKVEKQDISVSGAGAYQAKGLESQTARVRLDGVGKATVWVTGNLEVSINGLGSVEYYGSPTLSKSVHGLGSVKALGAP
ncbi:MAG: DUF2807 domain-containing protein [Anaerolineales bacterium]|jgi:hypothetical protein